MTLQLNFLEITTLCRACYKFQSLGHLFIQMILRPSALCICLFCVFFRFSALLCMSWFSSPTAFAIWKTKRNLSQDEIWLLDTITTRAARSVCAPRFKNYSYKTISTTPHPCTHMNTHIHTHTELLDRNKLPVLILNETLHLNCSWITDEEANVYRFFRRSVGRSCQREHVDSVVDCESMRERWLQKYMTIF